MTREYFTERSRDLNSRSLKTTVYVSCEGKTEKTYLNGLNKFCKDITIIPKVSGNHTALGVVEYLEKAFATKYGFDDEDTKKYCVFDSDANTKADLMKAKKKARDLNAKIIFSNPCFEIWLYWHYENALGNKSADELKAFIESKLGEDYCNDIKVYCKLQELQAIAMKNAETREAELRRDSQTSYSKDSNPFTNIHELVTDLLPA